MKKDTNKHGRLRRRILQVTLLTAAALLLAAPIAGASTAKEEGQGALVLRELEGGKLACGDLSGEDFDHVGEYAMGRMLASAGSHEAMDEVMARMMGSGSEAQVHEAMGRRFAGCGGAQLPAGFGRMMGALNAMGMMGGGTMGGTAWNGGPYGSSGSMMGGRWSETGGKGGDDDSNGPSAAAMIGMMAVLIAAVGIAVFFFSRRGPRSPLETLRQRYASGDLSAEDFEERKRLLEGS
ncbi:MAG: SHOCT domain-containing protein [Actinobacteria bacterium]|nr:SHOCT domain-containing protein [Actinomycetota bacterium]